MASGTTLMLSTLTLPVPVSVKTREVMLLTGTENENTCSAFFEKLAVLKENVLVGVEFKKAVTVNTAGLPTSTNENPSKVKAPPPTRVKVDVSFVFRPMHGDPEHLPSLTILAVSNVKPLSTYGVKFPADVPNPMVDAKLGCDAPTAPISPMATAKAKALERCNVVPVSIRKFPAE